MSHPVPATPYHIAAVAGGGSAVILLINAAKRAEVIPTSLRYERGLTKRVNDASEGIHVPR